MKIVISSGKGGTGKTFIATNIAYILNQMGEKITYLDCDVEAPNGYLFLKPHITNSEDVNLLSPVGVDNNKCIQCGKCNDNCKYHAINLIKDKIVFFKNLCHICGVCKLICPQNAIIEQTRKIGTVHHGNRDGIEFHYGLLETGEGGMTPRIIKKVKEYTGEGITILDSPPGTSCPVVETVKDADLCILVTDPTPFGINDLKLAAAMCRKLEIEPVVLVNRADYYNNDLKNYCIADGLEIIGEIPDMREVAELYSRGELAAESMPDLYSLLKTITVKMLKIAGSKKIPVKKTIENKFLDHNEQTAECSVKNNNMYRSNAKEVVVISGKGGTGKTSLTAAFCALEKKIAISDCDVDASDLHLLLNPQIIESGSFSGGENASINSDKCNQCGDCYTVCQFHAVIKKEINNKRVFTVNSQFCEGCGACSIVCNADAINFEKNINGEWFVSNTRFGPMSHAKLGIAEENSGKLVSLIRKKKDQLAFDHNIRLSIIDGSPGTGCPVIASITGTDYAVIVTEPTVSGVHDLKRILDVVKFLSIKSGVIVNKSDLNSTKTAEIKNIAADYVSDFLGTIDYDKSITESQMKNITVIEYTNNKITESIDKIWNNIKTMLFNKYK